MPVSTTRTVVAPMLEECSGLVAGKDFYLSFCPERTAEGVALHELQTLPQVIGSMSKLGLDDAIKFWSRNAGSVVVADSLEEAELVKLANNTYRDVSFAFANELALLANKYNIDANHLISIANDGYSSDIKFLAREWVVTV